MSNNLKKIEKDLRAFAKRCKDVKYTQALLYVFLMTGAVSFTATTAESIEGARKEIKTSITDMKKLFKDAKLENNKLMKQSSLELIQLMEQGDQAVKSQWSSWQYGMNYFYNDWTGTYKGRGDKTPNVKYERNPAGKFGNYLGGKFGKTNLSKKVIEPISAVPIDAAVKPKDIQKTALNINLPTIGAPTTPNLSISVKAPEDIKEITVTVPTVTVPTIAPNASPFIDFSFTHKNLTAGYTTPPAPSMTSNASGNSNNNRSIIWNGYNPGGGGYTNNYGYSNAPNLSVGISGSRPDYTVYANNSGNATDPDAFVIQNMNLYLAGNVGGAGQVAGNHDGVIGLHTVRNGTIRNVTANLYGKADFLSIETWHSGKIALSNVNVNITGDDNTIFYIYPASYEASNGYTPGLHAYHQRGGFTGAVNADIKSNKNIVYNVLGASGSFGIKSDGVYKLEGSENIVYSNTGYSPDFQKIANSPNPGAITNESYSPNMTPFINLSTPVESYGDGNILMFFNSQTAEKSTNSGGRISVWDQASTDNEALWDKSTVGIYQGAVGVNGIIGEFLDIARTPYNMSPTQTSEGRKTGSNPNYVEKNVGVLGWSGQRTGIKPAEDLGAATTVTNGAGYNVGDPIHSLWINDANVSFGKYALSGIMFASQNGTVMDVAKTTNENNAGADGVAVRTTAITDYGHLTSLATPGKVVSSEKDATNEAATGTILAYSQGVFHDKMNRMSNANTSFDGMGSEINIGTAVEMSARYHKIGTTEYYPIAYLAKDAGIITVEGTTKAKGYGSLVAYAENLGYVETTGDVTAVDEWADTSDDDTKKLLYTNIGAYAKTGAGSYSSQVGGIDARNGSGNLDKTVITMKGNLEIHGMGALANGTKAIVTLKGEDNKITTGTSGGLVAQNGGTVNFYGGTITNKDNHVARGLDDNDHTNVTPFYAKGIGGNSDGVIVFHPKTGATTPAAKAATTTLKMYDGVVIADTPTEYKDSETATTGRYRGLKNVTVEINNNDVIMGIFNNTPMTWYNSTDTGTTTFRGTLPGLSSFGNITYNSGATFYTTILKNSTLNVIAPTVTLDDISDQYNGIKMANEMVTISNSTTVSGDVSSTSLKGQGLSMGNLPTAVQIAAGITPSNTTSGFKNEGTVNVTGGTVANGIAGMNVSYGTIQNGTAAGSTASVTIDNGAGIYGTNGSKLQNYGTITVTGSGAGIAARGTDKNVKQTYGTDNVNNGNVIEIENHGTINVAGNNPVGIYAENNTQAARNRVLVSNDKQLTVGDNGVGIAVLASPIETGQQQGSPLAPVAGVDHGAGSDQGGTITVTASGTGSDILTGANGKGIYAKNSDINLTGGDYVIETKEKGIGIFASGDTNVNGTLEYKYNGNASEAGMGIVYDHLGTPSKTNLANVKLNNSTATTGGMIGVYTIATSGTLINQGDITGTSSALEFGIVSNGADVINDAGHKIELGNAAAQANANVGIYSKAKNKTVNKGSIIVGDNAIGIYGYDVDNDSGSLIKVGDNGVAVYTHDTGTNVNLNTGSTITVGGNQAVGVYAVGTNQNLNANSGATMNIGDNSFGFVNAGTGNTVTSRIGNISLGNDSIYIYQNDGTGKVFNYTSVTSTGDKNYALYGNGIMENHGIIDFSTGNGNVGVYSTGGTARNYGNIKVGASNTAAKEFGVGMATGYYNETTDTVSNQGTIINHGTIEVSKPNTMGMYAVGAGSKAINYGHINLTGSETIGMYIDREAVGENWGTIQTTANGLTKVKGVYVANGGYIKNYGIINIAASDLKSAGIWTDNANRAEEDATGTNPVTGAAQTGTSTPGMKVVTADDMKEMGGITIKVPPRMTLPTVTDAQGNIIPIYKVDTDIASPVPMTAIVTSPTGATSIDLATSNFLNSTSASEATSLGMYVDTSGVNYTNPIQGISNLRGLSDINLYFGVEASKYTTARAIEVGDNILKPYNDALSGLVTAGTTLNVTSASLTWMAQPTKNATTGLLDKVYLVKIPYTIFANKDDTQTYNFLAGLEQKYGAEGLGTKEKSILDKISSLNKGEGHILAQAFDEMKGHQYSNIQQRTKETGDILSKEFNYLQDEWQNTSKDNNKIKAFGYRGEYNTGTAGVVDYTNNAYGVAYVHENETVKLGRKSGWYAGAVTNRFEFKDLGKSREIQTMIKAGLFKTMSPKSDHNGSFTWTIAGEAFVGRNDMKRKYWIVDDTFEAKSDYTTYGVALKNEIGKAFRTSERTSIRPYGALNLEYGTYSGIKEEGPMALELKGNDYFSVQPELGISFNYNQPVGLKSHFKASLTAAYTNEVGKVNDVKNKAKLKGTTTDYYELRGDKEDRKGNGKFDLNIGVDNTRFGVTLNGGYDTKGKNVRGGIGFRIIY